MLHRIQRLVAVAFLVAVSGVGIAGVAQAGGLSRDLTSPLAVLRAYKERTGEFEKQDTTEVQEISRKAGKVSARKAKIAKLISQVAKKHGVPVALATAVVTVESNFNPNVRGSAGEIGLMQIKPATARGMGFSGSAKALYSPEVNLEWGMRYLAKAHDLAGGDVCGTILRYNAGHGARRMNPISRRYCGKVKGLLSRA